MSDNNDKAILVLVQSARQLLSEAESLNMQPLFYKKDGFYVDVVGVLKEVEGNVKECIDLETRK